MGLLDGLAGNLMGNALGSLEGRNSAVSSIIQMIQNQPGGIAGLAEKFQQGGLGNLVQSWIGTGQNLPVTGNQIQDVVGSDAINDVAQKLGVPPETASAHLAELLPQIVNQLTPNGQVPAQNDLLSMGAGLLKSFMR